MKKTSLFFATLLVSIVLASAQIPARNPNNQALPCPVPLPVPPPTTPPAKDPELSIFGIGSSAAGGSIQPRWMPQMAAIGIRDCRHISGGWGIEKVQGVFDYTALDAKLAFADSIGMQGGMLLLGGPWWKKGPAAERGLPMGSLPEWAEMVSKNVEHTKGRVKYFEVWNEPPNGTAKTQTPADYGKLVTVTYEAAKKANPGAMVGIAAKSAHINYLDQAIIAGAHGNFDYVTLHPYELLGCVVNHPGMEPMFLNIVPTVRKMLAKRDPSKVNCPVIFTEIGFDSRRGLDKQAQAVLKCYIMGIHQGVASIDLYEGMDGDSGPLGLLDIKGNQRPSYYGLARLIESVGRHPKSAGWVMLNGKHYGFMVEGDKGPVLLTWAATTNPDTVDFGEAVEVLDLTTGNTKKGAKQVLNAFPIAIKNPPAKLVTDAKANLGKPVPWGGDYAKAKSVFVTFADKYEEKGLHTMAADLIAADVVAYGGNARAGEVPKGGNAFIVDPAFLTYDTVPLEITVMVKRDATNKPENLELEYESTTGYKKMPAVAVPEGDQWQKVSWKIDDCQFVTTWTFNFRLNAGKRLVKDVTVTRLDR